MKTRHILGGLLGIGVLLIWGIVHMTFSFIFTGKAFPND